MSALYRDRDGSTWQADGDDRVTLIKVSDPEDEFLIGHDDFTDIPFDEVEQVFGLTPITGGVQ